jgi:hypothetical protein
LPVVLAKLLDFVGPFCDGHINMYSINIGIMPTNVSLPCGATVYTVGRAPSSACPCQHKFCPNFGQLWIGLDASVWLC